MVIIDNTDKNKVGKAQKYLITLCSFNISQLGLFDGLS